MFPGFWDDITNVARINTNALEFVPVPSHGFEAVNAHAHV